MRDLAYSARYVEIQEAGNERFCHGGRFRAGVLVAEADAWGRTTVPTRWPCRRKPHAWLISISILRFLLFLVCFQFHRIAVAKSLPLLDDELRRFERALPFLLRVVQA